MDYGTNIPSAPSRMPARIRKGHRSAEAAHEAAELYKWFENGPTKEWEAYHLQLPTDPKEYDRERRRITGVLLRVRNRFNERHPNQAEQLVHRVASEPGHMYVVIERKYRR